VTRSKGSAKKLKIPWGKALLLMFVAAWMFVLGVLVGRGTAPVHFDIMALQKELASLRQAKVEKERQTVENTMRGEGQKAPLEFYEALKKDGLDTSVKSPPPGETDSGLIASAQATPVVSIPHKSKAPILGKNGKKAVADKSKRTSPQPNKKTSSGPLTIQIASLKDGGEAGRIVANLKKEGYSAYLSKVVIPEKGLWYRVRVGSYKDKEQAAADMERLTKARKEPILLER
jgi:cell division septation protein DedD